MLGLDETLARQSDGSIEKIHEGLDFSPIGVTDRASKPARSRLLAFAGGGVDGDSGFETEEAIVAEVGWLFASVI